MAAIRADHERDVALVAVVRPCQQGNVDAGDGRRRDLPGRGHRPRSAIVEFRADVGEALGLRLPQGGRSDIGNFAGAESLVPAGPVDADRVVGRRGVHLEADGLARIDTDLGREPLDVRIAGAGDVPFRGRAAGFGIFTRHSVQERGAGIRCVGGRQQRRRRRHRQERCHQGDSQRKDYSLERFQRAAG